MYAPPLRRKVLESLNHGQDCSDRALGDWGQEPAADWQASPAVSCWFAYQTGSRRRGRLLVAQIVAAVGGVLPELKPSLLVLMPLPAQVPAQVRLRQAF